VCADLVEGRAIRRSALVRAVDAGLGFWLRGVEVAPHRVGGRFGGWRVRKIHAGDPCFALVDIRPGDIVVRVNRRTLERPEEAHALWESLRAAPAVTVELVREGERRTLTLPVADEAEAPGSRK
jgi:type II secretory pathway component PulC